MKKFGFLLVSLLMSCLCFASPLPVKDVFQINVDPMDANTFIVNWHIKDGYFLYKDRIKLTPKPDSNYSVGDSQFPEFIKKITPQGKTYSVYRNQLVLPISVLGTQAGEGLLDIHYQGCSDDGFCYPPQVSQIKLTIDKQLALSQVELENNSLPNALNEEEGNDEFSHVFSDHHWTIILLFFFGFGLLLAFTPCVLPMVPVLSGIIVGHGSHLSTRKGFLLSLTYVLSMSFTYACVGAVVALMGSNLQVLMQSPWTIGLFSFIFILLALSMFGVYELRMPISWQAKFASLSRFREHGHYLSTAFMGCFSTLILSPCVTAPLIGALAYIAQKGNVLLGSTALFCLSLGMGVPLILVGMSAGKLLPKAGIWMNTIKSIFGILLFGTAIYLLQRILQPALTMWLWALLCIFSGIYMGALQKAVDGHQKFRQGVGLIFLCYGILILIGASQGHTNPLKPLMTQSTQSAETTITVTTLKQVKEVLANASAQSKPVFIDFYADWCASCQEIEATTMKDPRIDRALSPFVRIKVDLTKNNRATQRLLTYFHVVAPPTLLFFDKVGQEAHKLRLVGSVGSDKFISTIEQFNEQNS